MANKYKTWVASRGANYHQPYNDRPSIICIVIMEKEIWINLEEVAKENFGTVADLAIANAFFGAGKNNIRYSVANLLKIEEIEEFHDPADILW